MNLRDLTRTSAALLALSGVLGGFVGGGMAWLGSRVVSPNARIAAGERSDSILRSRIREVVDSGRMWHRMSVDTDRAMQAEIMQAVAHLGRMDTLVREAKEERAAQQRRSDAVLMILCTSEPAAVSAHIGTAQLCAALIGR